MITRVADTSRKNSAPQGVEIRLDRTEALLRAPTGSPQAPLARGVTWAKVAATGMREAGATETALPIKHTVRVQMTQAKGMGNEEILKEMKRKIPGAAAIQVLRSGDIDVVMPDEASKDRAHGLPSTEELKILKKDYLVEVPGVWLSVRVVGERGADNTRLLRGIADYCPGLIDHKN